MRLCFWSGDPVLNLFYWFSGLSVVAIVLIEILVCLAIIMYFRRNKGEENLFQTTIAPILATIGLVLGEYLLMSRFGLLAGTVADGVDPTVTSWGTQRHRLGARAPALRATRRRLPALPRAHFRERGVASRRAVVRSAPGRQSRGVMARPRAVSSAMRPSV